MGGRVQLGWRVPRDERDAFIRHVEDKWGEAASYLRFEIESAMHQYLDRDAELADAERLLRERLDARDLSSSSAGGDRLSRRVDHSDTVLLTHRVNPGLKDEFAAYADQNTDESYGAVLSRALNAYRDGGRATRVKEAAERLITGATSTGSTAASDETSTADASHRSGSTVATDENGLDCRRHQRGSTGASDEHRRTRERNQAGSTDAGDESSDESEAVTVDPETVVEIADGLPDEFPEQLLEQRIRDAVADTDAAVAAFRDPVVNHTGLVSHPYQELYITPENRERSLLYCDMDRAERVERLRELLVTHTLERGKRTNYWEYTDVIDRFAEEYGAGPSHDYAYTLMERAGELDGFRYGRHRGRVRLRVDIHDVPRDRIKPIVEGNDELDPRSLTMDGLVTAYSAGSPPSEPEAVDD